jgi:RNA ligase (TIGR02306 family)
MTENLRKLVTVRAIDAIEPIDGADAIELAVVEGWKVVIKKGEFAVGDKCVYFEIDSFLPTGNPAWQFLVDKSSRTFEDVVGHRLRTIKLRGQISQGLVLKLDQVPLVTNLDRDFDQAEILGIKKWEQPLPAELAGQAEGLFPGWMRKTDQERCQNLMNDIFQYEDQLVEFDVSCVSQEALDAMRAKMLVREVDGKTFKVSPAKADADALYEVTTKLDGSSMTVFARSIATNDPSLSQIESGVCSRNLQLKVNAENAENTFISVALKSGLLGALENMTRDGEGNVAVQGELMGPGIQGNREQLKTHQFFIFDVQFLDGGSGYLTPSKRGSFMRALHDRGVNPDLVKHVPVQYVGVTLAELGITSVKDLLARAEHPSITHPVSEGDVYKRMDGKFSFKAISNTFLAKEKD